jgi:hypothetical protein
MTERLLKDVYKTPLAVVRGFFLCDGIADAVSTDNIVSRGDWGSGGTLKPEEDDLGEKYWMVF